MPSEDRQDVIVSKIVQLDLAISETANDDVARYRFRDERRARSMRVCLDHLRLINWMHSNGDYETHSGTTLSRAIPDIDHARSTSHTQHPALSPPCRNQSPVVIVRDGYGEAVHVQGNEGRDRLHVLRLICRTGQDVDVPIA